MHRILALITLLAAAAVAAPLHAQHDVNGDGKVTILFPISHQFDSDDRLPGGYGSLWSVEVWIHNGTPAPLGKIQEYECVIGICNEFHPPNRTEGTSVMSAGVGQGGLVTLAPQSAPEVSFSARLFEHSRRSQPNGVETPVVWEGNFLRGVTRLVGVPSRPDGRVTLRIYDPYPTNSPKPVRVDFVSRTGAILGTTNLFLTLPPDPKLYMPGYAAIGDVRAAFDGVADDEVFDIVLTPSGSHPYYAFASDTDRDTQNVLLITPATH